MATRSEFAQKLLIDLRLRKERMAASQSSSHSTRMDRGDVHGNLGRNYKGSGQVKGSGYVGSRLANSQRRSSSNSAKSTNIEKSSKQIVPFGGGQNLEPIGDLSMALALALENRGKLAKLNSSGSTSILSFLHQNGWRSLDMGKKMERSSSFDMRQNSSQFPTISYVHINEVSKGAQKLNQILKACFDGHNFDRYSIEIGRELLKGARDLEESLRMLVNLQEASEYMISPQRKNRIRLLEEEEDDEDSSVKIAEQKKQVYWPKFSFDKPSRNGHGITQVKKTDLKQNLMALTYPSEVPDTSKLVPRKRSTTIFGPDFKAFASFSELKNRTSSSQSKHEKGRITNVVAKLMGLEDLPQNVDSKSTKKESDSMQKEGMVSKKIAHPITTNVVTKTRDSENLIPLPIGKSTIQTPKLPKTQYIQMTRKANSELAGPDGKLRWKDLERAHITNPDSKKVSIAKDKQQSNGQFYQFSGTQNDFQGVRTQNITKNKEEMSIERGETKGSILRDDVPKHANMLQEKIGGMESTMQKEKRNTNRLLPRNQQKPQCDHGNRKFEPRDQEKTKQAEKREQQSIKHKSQVRKQKGTEAEPQNPSKPTHEATGLKKKQQYTNEPAPSKRISTEIIDERLLKGLPKSKNWENLVRDGSSTNLKVNIENSTQGGDLGSETGKAKGSIPTVAEEKSVHVLASQKKVDHTKMHKSEIPRKIGEAIARRNRTLHDPARQPKHQISILQDMKQRGLEKIRSSKGAEQMSDSNSKEAEVQNIRRNKLESSIKSLNGALPLNKEPNPTWHRSGEHEHYSPSITPSFTANESFQDIATEFSTVPIGSKDGAPVFGEGQELVSPKTVLYPCDGDGGGSKDIPCLSPSKHEESSAPGMQELMTEKEMGLKRILIKSQLFLNTVETLFKFTIPISILDITDYNGQDEDSKLILDCGYEIMRRKGRRQELALHPHAKNSISSAKVTSLNDLVKQLHKDFEKLKSCGENGKANDEHYAGEHLNRMLERDIQNRDLDANSMWDFGWYEMKSAVLEKDDIIRDVERSLVNGLIDEIAKELFHVAAST
ncbi:hypothetical protein U1Q18_016171 [Sarracenia purpurea var. burkii]